MPVTMPTMEVEQGDAEQASALDTLGADSLDQSERETAINTWMQTAFRGLLTEDVLMRLV